MYIFNQYIGGVLYEVEEHLGGQKCGCSVICPEDSTQQVRGKPLSVRGPYWRTPPPCAGRPPRCTFPLVAKLNCVLGQVGKALSKRWICSKPVTHTTDAYWLLSKMSRHLPGKVPVCLTTAGHSLTAVRQSKPAPQPTLFTGGWFELTVCCVWLI